MTVVEIGRELAVLWRGALGIKESRTERSEETCDEDGVQTHRLYSPNVTDPATGIRYQRCGGGRRVIRRQSWND